TPWRGSPSCAAGHADTAASQDWPPPPQAPARQPLLVPTAARQPAHISRTERGISWEVQARTLSIPPDADAPDIARVSTPPAKPVTILQVAIMWPSEAFPPGGRHRARSAKRL